MALHSRIVNVLRKPGKCPVCGEPDAIATAMSLINGGGLALKGRFCKVFDVAESAE